MKSLQILHTNYLHVLDVSQISLDEGNHQMYHDSVVSPLLNIYLISLLAHPLQFQIQTGKFSARWLNVHYWQQEH